MRGTRWILPAAIAVVPVLGAVPALASCAPLPPIEQALAEAPAVFVGTVTATLADGRLAQVEVDEVWKGEVAGTVTVKGGETTPGVMTSVDRTYEEGSRYLFVPFSGADGVFQDNSCSHTQVYTTALDALRPADAHPPVTIPPPDLPTAGSPSAGWLWGGAGLGAVLLALAALTVTRRRRPRRPAISP